MRFTEKQVQEARAFWGSLSDTELHEYWLHYTQGNGRGMYLQVKPDTSFRDFLVLSANETAAEAAYNL